MTKECKAMRVHIGGSDPHKSQNIQAHGLLALELDLDELTEDILDDRLRGRSMNG